MPEKTYTEVEVSVLLRRAARLQAARGTSEQEVLTLAEIKAAAADAGIDARFVDMAASASSDHSQTYWSIPTGVGRSLFVRGTLTDARWRQMVAMFSLTFGGPGETETKGTRRTWSLGALRITAEDINGQVALHAETEWGKDLELPIALSLVGGIAAATTVAVAFVSLEWTIGLVAALLTALVVGLFAAYRSRMVRKQKRLRGSFEAVLDHCADLLYEEPSPTLEADRINRPSFAGGVTIGDEGQMEEPDGRELPRPSRRSGQR